MKQEISEKVTNAIVKAMEEGAQPWRKPWTTTGNHAGLPQRVTGEAYRGINIILLWTSKFENGYSSDVWMTYRQAQQIGAQVKKGEKGTRIYKFGSVTKNDDEGDDQSYKYTKEYVVFNVDQIEGFNEGTKIQDNNIEISGPGNIKHLDDFFQATGGIIRVSGMPRAFYSIQEDIVHMPKIEKFESAQRYYGVLAHEFIHWTGAEKRLDRLKRFRTKQEYAFEELVAEIGSCFLCTMLEVEPDFEQSAAYIESWIAHLKKDSQIIWRAAAEAQKAVDMLTEYSSGALREVA